MIKKKIGVSFNQKYFIIYMTNVITKNHKSYTTNTVISYLISVYALCV